MSHNAQMDSSRTFKLELAHHAKCHVLPAQTLLNVIPANQHFSLELPMANAMSPALQEPTPVATIRAARLVLVVVPLVRMPRTVLPAHLDHSSTEFNVETLAHQDTTEMPLTISADNVTPLVVFAMDPHQVSAHNVPQLTY